MADAFIIEMPTMTAGIVAVEGRDFRFHASHPAVHAIDGQVFGSLKAARRAAESLARQPKPAPYRNRKELAEERRRTAPAATIATGANF
jgi:hypothetical protein